MQICSPSRIRVPAALALAGLAAALIAADGIPPR